MKRMKRRKGFTIVEVLVSVALLAVVALLMYSFLGQGFTLYSLEATSAEEQTDIRMVLSEITNKVRLTDKSAVTYNAGVLTVGDYQYAFDGERIVRNSVELANGIESFGVNITNSILNISITNNAGTQISTSLSLVE